MTRLKPLFLSVLVACFASLARGQTAVVVEAESGVRGAEFTTAADGTVQYLTAGATGAGGSPGSDARVATLTVTFPAAGTYELYARIRVGPGAGNDDSFFYATGFGVKNAGADADWITVNQLAAVGYSTASDTVGAAGTAGSSEWKWLKLSAFGSDEPGVDFVVSAGALTQTFQLGAREDGLWIDKFAFGPQGTAFTVSNLDNGTNGTGGGSSSTEPYVPPGPPLAVGKTKFVGSAYSSPSQTLYFERYWNQVTPENASKWGSVEGTRDTMNWTALDAAYTFAKTNGFPFKFHTLIWGSQQPNWISALPAAEQLEEITEWFAAAAARYPDIDQIDVVNEPIRATPNGSAAGRANYIAALGGAGATGWDWVITSFQMARQYFPRAKLLLNEYNVTNSTSVTATYAGIAQLLKDRGLIDAIGIQQHAFETRGVATATLRTNLDTLAALGLPLFITEFDVDGLNEQSQREEYQRLFPLFWEHSAVQGITLWGWRPGLWRHDQGAYIVQENGAERLAMLWLKEYLNNVPVVPAQAFTLAENPAAGAVVGTVAGLDWEGATLSEWTIVDGNGAALFAIDSATGQITVASGATVAAQSYTLNVRARDASAASAPGAVTINVSNQPQKVAGTGYEFAGNITHPANGNVYDQILITGPNTTFRADAGQVVRASYIDVDDDIVQIEFSGAGTVTVTLAGATPPALPEKYNQSIGYVKGHATITLADTDANTHFSVFTVGRGTAVNQALFKDVEYDGFADIALVNVTSASNRFGSVRMANTEFWHTSGNTGLNAPGVRFGGPVLVHNISAQQDATPLLLTGLIDRAPVAGVEYDNAIHVAGGDMAQANARAVRIGDAGQIVMRAGSDSHNVLHPAKTNQAVYERNGVNVTGSLFP